ncbi:glycoside hydrolase family 25 protein [Albidovulum sp.]|uniref:glycoside hydrolase family 25 protein n=1 Tax=Albidovulum sp. TaxID=1872424 RepID=UPI001DAD8F31|nr:glycoside hydrolase family 25 protein [Paracoccaceae bacterium]
MGHCRRGFARILTVVAIVALAACSGPGRRVHGIPGAFRDLDPHAWRGVTPAAHPVHGVDVSRWQGAIDWPLVARSGVSFAYLKATEGGDHADPAFQANWHGAGAAGLPRGAYHFYYHCRPADEQARWFIAHAPRAPGALPPVLDIEWSHSPSCPRRPDPASVRASIVAFQGLVGAHFGQRPVIYTTVDFYRDNDLGQLTGEEFWLRSVAGHPSDRFRGQRWTFWQYTGTGVVRGISGPADLNAFAGSETAWSAWRARRSQ